MIDHGDVMRGAIVWSVNYQTGQISLAAGLETEALQSYPQSSVVALVLTRISVNSSGALKVRAAVRPSIASVASFSLVCRRLTVFVWRPVPEGLLAVRRSSEGEICLRRVGVFHHH